MNYAETQGLRISQLALGTVQLGLQYGIANRTGKPGRETAHAILQHALDAGVNTLDTAAIYGDSEEVIGSFLAERQPDPPPIIVTKLAQVQLDGEPSAEAVHEHVRGALAASAARLGLETIPVCLLHHVDDLTSYGGKVIGSVVRLKDEGFLGRIGASTYRPDDVDTFLGLGVFDAIQIPINLFDHRLIEGGHLRRLAEAGAIVFARSVFLQGIFFRDPDRLEWFAEEAREPLRKLRRLSADCGRPIAELAVAFVRDLPGIASLVIGCETVEQLAANIELVTCPPLPDDLRATLRGLFADMPEAAVNPAIWDQRRAEAGKTGETA